LPALHAATILVAMASQKKYWGLNLQQKSSIFWQSSAKVRKVPLSASVNGPSKGKFS